MGPEAGWGMRNERNLELKGLTEHDGDVNDKEC